MNLILLDTKAAYTQLLPFTFTRPISAIRVGILTIAEKWEKVLDVSASFATESHLQGKYPLKLAEINLVVGSSVCPNEALLNAIDDLEAGEALVQHGKLLAARCNAAEVESLRNGMLDGLTTKEFSAKITLIEQPWHIFQHNGQEIHHDYTLLTSGRRSAPISDPHTRTYCPENIFIEEGVIIKAAILNAENGPIYLGKDAQVHEGAIIKGPFALCEGSHINMGAKIRGDVTVGPHSKVGGEVSNSVIFGYSNKAHDGFLGNSVIGEWCNLGADTNSSNLKNNYAQVKLWSFAKEGFIDTGLQFCGLMMGDHAKSGINTMFNTATVVGVAANVFGDGFPRTYIPSYAWGGAAGFSTFKFDKALEVANAAMARRKMQPSDEDILILKAVYEMTAKHRIWEK